MTCPDATPDHPEQQSDPCVICLDTITQKCTAQPCGHASFDFPCLITWLVENPSCPLCKGVPREVQYRDKADGSEKSFLVPPPVVRKPKAIFPSSEPVPLFSLYSHWSPPTPGHPGRRIVLNHHRRHRQSATSTAAEIAQQAAIARRREIYRRRMYSCHVGSNPISQYREVDAHTFTSDPTVASRARMWMRRELQAFETLPFDPLRRSFQDTVAISSRRARRHPDPSQQQPPPPLPSRQQRGHNAEFLLEFVVAVLRSVDIQSYEAEEMLRDYFGQSYTRLFLHELRAWLRSPFKTLEEWDQAVQYDMDGPLLAISGRDSPGRGGGEN